jgi:CheY-like chemotaxis protein
VILFVEDHTVSREAFAKILRTHAHEVMEAADGNEALELLDKHHFDLVITDMVLPNLNGLTLIDRIRIKWPHMSILLLSAYLSQHAGKTLLVGEAEFLQKPVDASVLIATVERLLATSR